MSVSATDADDPMTDNAALSFSIIGQESFPANAINKTMFGINNETGTIYTRDVGLDREVSVRVKKQLGLMWLLALIAMCRVEGGEELPIEATSGRHGRDGTDERRRGRYTRVGHQQPPATVQPRLGETLATGGGPTSSERNGDFVRSVGCLNNL